MSTEVFALFCMGVASALVGSAEDAESEDAKKAVVSIGSFFTNVTILAERDSDGVVDVSMAACGVLMILEDFHCVS